MTAVCHKKVLALCLNSSTTRTSSERFPEPCYGTLAVFFVPEFPRCRRCPFQAAGQGVLALTGASTSRASGR